MTDQSPDSSTSLPDRHLTPGVELALTKEASTLDLKRAINNCKELILANPEYSVERKWLVRHLIELRLRMQELIEAQNDPDHPKNKSGVSSRFIKGHHLKLQSLLKNASHKYCDHCTGTIWSVVQAWYMCENCEYICHYKCISSILRECAHIIACEKGYQLDICPETGMSTQKYLCAECEAPLVLNKDWTDIRQCDYTGRYYCSACHWDSSAIIPARVVHNWDFTPRLVSQIALQILRVTSERPILNLDRLNPKLFDRVPELNLVKRLRNELRGIRKYLLVCRSAQKQRLLWKCPRPHLLEDSDNYSLQDLVDTRSGDLPSKLHDLVDVFSNHIKFECQVCKGRGHVCEICRNVEILFPFTDSAYTCQSCCSVFHRQCFERVTNGCPKCLRITRRLLEEQEQVN